MAHETILLAFGSLTNQNHQLIAEHLTDLGYQLLCPCNMQEMDLMMTHRPDLDFIIFSSALPGINGYDSLATIRSQYRDLPIVLMMNTLNIESLRLATLLGFNEILQEPVGTEELDSLLSKYQHEINHLTH